MSSTLCTFINGFMLLLSCKAVAIMNKIRELRKEKGLTLDGLSKELQEKENLKIGSNALGKYERGLREPKLKTWQALAKYFDVSVSYLQGITSVESEKYIKSIHDFKDLIITVILGVADAIQSEESVKNLKKYNLTYRDITLIKQGLILSSEIVNNFEKEYTFFDGSRGDVKEKAYLMVKALQKMEIKVNDKDIKILNNLSDETTDKD